jgi:DedD protein
LNSRYDSDSELQELHEQGGQDREISLGTATILGIFFALALLCAVFFGFGYSLGRRSAQTVATAAVDTPVAAESTGGSKPAPGSQLSQPSAVRQANSAASIPATPDNSSAPAADKIIVRETVGTPTPDAHPVSAAPQQVSSPAVVAAPTVAIGTPGSAVVQVAAVSHQEDADVLVTALKRKGYNVAIRQVPQDKLLHVQIGPFATKKDAEAMRQRLLADGYNAIVK